MTQTAILSTHTNNQTTHPKNVVMKDEAEVQFGVFFNTNINFKKRKSNSILCIHKLNYAD